jgi:hypothetical protein
MFAMLEILNSTRARPEPPPPAVPWTPKLAWARRLHIEAATYQPISLYDVRPSDGDIQQAKPDEMIVSPCGRWCYVEKLLPAGTKLSTYSGSKRGYVSFTGPVLIPALHARGINATWWQRDPWMGLTPMEMFTLRPGTRKARGSVVVAGLGLGHQLIEVSHKRSVKRLVLVEKDQSLVDWLLPRITPFLGRKLDDVVIGDAYKALDTITCDIALIDIFPSYGNNTAYTSHHWHGVRDVWVWGSAPIA